MTALVECPACYGSTESFNSKWATWAEYYADRYPETALNQRQQSAAHNCFGNHRDCSLCKGAGQVIRATAAAFVLRLQHD